MSTRTLLILENIITITATALVFCYTKSPWALVLLINMNTKIP